MKLLVIDGNAVLHRAYYALPDWRNRSGEATAGVYGFLSILLKAVDELKPTHLAVVFDTPEPTFRHLMYVGYQHGREKDRQVSEDIWGQVEKLRIVLEKMGVPVFSVPGFEADDVIGTLCQKANDGESEVVVITGDRDLMQLVNERVKLFMPLKGMTDMTIIDEAKVMERMGVHPGQIIDYKGLVGDSSDNYPGVAGIGPKTAIHLLAEYGTLENIYVQIQTSNDKFTKQVSNSNIQKLANGYDAAKLSQTLATIKCDVPIDYDCDKCQLPSMEKITDVLKELGYKSLIKRMTGEEVKIDENQTKLFE